MSQANVERYEHYRSRLPQYGQEHLLRFWDELNPAQQGELLADLDAVDFDLVSRHECQPLGRFTRQGAVQRHCLTRILHGMYRGETTCAPQRIRYVGLR